MCAGLVKSYRLPTMDSEILQVPQVWGYPSFF